MQGRAPSLRTLWEGKDPETVYYPNEAPGFKRRRGCAQWRRQAFLLGVGEGGPQALPMNLFFQQWISATVGMCLSTC